MEKAKPNISVQDFTKNHPTTNYSVNTLPNEINGIVHKSALPIIETIKKRTELGEKIIHLEFRVNNLKGKIAHIEEPDSKYSASLDLKINTNRFNSRTPSVSYTVTKEEVLIILKRELKRLEAELIELMKEYNH